MPATANPARAQNAAVFLRRRERRYRRHPARHGHKWRTPECLSAVRRQPRQGKPPRDASVPLKPQMAFEFYRVHINGFAAIAPTRRNGNGHAHVLATEFFFTGGDSAIPANTGIRNDALPPVPRRRGGIFGDERRRRFRHVSRFALRATFAYAHTTSINMIR